MSSYDAVIARLRDHLTNVGYLEVSPKLRHRSLPLEPTLYAVREGDDYLATSPEAELKKFLALHQHNCFAFGESARDLELDTTLHYPKFLMLEFYRLGASYRDIMAETRKLLMSLPDHPSTWNRDWPELSLIDLFHTYAHLSLPLLLDDQAMHDTAASLGYQTASARWEELFHQIVLNELEPHFPKTPFFLTDYPSLISPLAAPKKGLPAFAERFELFINGIELANGNTENQDTVSIRLAMDKEKIYRDTHHLHAPPLDLEFFQALRAIPSPFAGVGIGIDRLVMLLENKTSLPPKI